MRFGLAMATLLGASAFAAVGPAAQMDVKSQGRPVAALSPAASAVVARWRAELRAETKRVAAGKRLSIGDDLKRRIAIEQAGRRHLPERASSGLNANDWEAANKAIWKELGKIDAENTNHLKRILPRDGWFRIKRDGEQVASNAWLIVQHSPDHAFQRRVLDLMMPLVATGDASGGDYALLFDRVAMFEGKRQRYGSQIVCNDGRFEPSPVEDPARLDQLRASVGLEPIAEYLRNWEGKSC